MKAWIITNLALGLVAIAVSMVVMSAFFYITRPDGVNDATAAYIEQVAVFLYGVTLLRHLRAAYQADEGVAK